MTMEENNGHMKLPVVHDVCPVCGSKTRLGADYIQELKDAGELHKDLFPNGLMFLIPLLDPVHPPTILGPMIKRKIVNVYWDVCECGAMYCTKFEVVDAPVQMQMQRQGPPAGFRNFPGGSLRSGLGN